MTKAVNSKPTTWGGGSSGGRRRRRGMEEGWKSVSAQG